MCARHDSEKPYAAHDTAGPSTHNDHECSPAVRPTGCQHIFCVTCTSDFAVKTKHHRLPATCPVPECEGTITLAHIIHHIPGPLGSAIEQRSLEASLLSNDNSAESTIMYCPNKRCSTMLTIDPEAMQNLARNGTRFEPCPRCNVELCSACKSVAHIGRTCQEYRALPAAAQDVDSYADTQLADLAEKQAWKQCPRCQHMVELDTGCNHITCRCAHEFCYKCLSPWDTRNKRCARNPPCELWDEANILQERAGPAVQVQAPPAPAAFPIAQRGYVNLVELDAEKSYVQPWLRECMNNKQCVYCERTFGALMDLDRHLANTRQHEVWSCCGRIFKTERAREMHRENSATH